MTREEAKEVLNMTQMNEGTIEAILAKLGQLCFPRQIGIYHSHSEEDTKLARILQAVITLAWGDARLISEESGAGLYAIANETDVILLLCSHDLFKHDTFLKDFYFAFRQSGFGNESKKLIPISLDTSIPAYRDEDIPFNTHPVASNLRSFFTLGMRNWRQGELEQGCESILRTFANSRKSQRPISFPG